MTCQYINIFMRYNEIDEADRIGSGVYTSEIHPSLKHLPILNRGTTSIILEKDPETVIILTKDPIKKDWLINGLKIANQVNYYESNHPKLKDMPIYVLEMPRLYPIGQKTRKAAKDLLKSFTEIRIKAMYTGKYGDRKEAFKERIITLFYELFDEYNENNTNEHALERLVGFIADYNPEQYEWDLRMGNLMQDKDENLVILDPIIDSEIMNAFAIH